MTYKKILDWENHLSIPDDVEISDEAADLIFKLINHRDARLGLNGADEIKIHPFFKGINWRNLKAKSPSFVPKVSLIVETCSRY